MQTQRYKDIYSKIPMNMNLTIIILISLGLPRSLLKIVYIVWYVNQQWKSKEQTLEFI